ncbi:TonB-dependent receptor plug domain-containing protein [Pelosinus baikalensis]|uniref:TonB-dependent receptor n=1 Tax=Pelosinus baikalensis TaxID=2892015 RepID=A0ABS8HL64_9FIRM|nr:TonB-dependent receptor [Pelosinus baikalensis]
MVTANRIPVRKSEVAANVTVITQDEIEKGGFTRLSDVLRKNNVEMGESSFATYPILNGDDRVLVLIDGRKMNWSHLTVSGNDHAINIDSLSTKNIERIEIVRGPGSSLYGSDAVGGVINIITRKAETTSTSIASEFGNWGLRRYSLTTEGKTNGIGYFVTAEQKKRDSFKYKDATTGATKTFADSQIDQKLITLRLDKELGEGRALSLQVDHTEDQQGFGAALNNGAISYPGGYEDLSSNNIALTYSWKQNTEAENFFRVYRNASEGTTYNSLLKSDGITPYSYDLNAKGAEWQQSWKLNENQTLLGGANWREEHLDDEDSLNRSVSTKSVFLENRWKLPSKWTLSVGTRYDDQSIVGDNTTSRLAINREINENTNIYASWGQSVRNPTIAQLFSNTSYWIGNPNLKPETGSTITVGMNTKFKGGTKLQASLYSSQLKNALDWRWDGITQYFNVDREKRQGLDLNFTHKLSPQWDLSAGYAYTKIKRKTDGASSYTNDINNSQPNGYHLGVQYNQDKWNADLTMRSATGRSLEGYTSKSYLTLDMVVNYQLNSSTRIYAKGYNLTNEAYELAHVWYDAGSYPMPGRSFYVGVEHRM